MATNPAFLREIPSDETVSFSLDGKKLTARKGETIWQAAHRHGIEIPYLCYREGYRPDGNCRACMVEIEGERTLAPSCARPVTEDMTVNLSDRAVKSQKLVVELLSADVSDELHTRNSLLKLWAEELGVGKPRFPGREHPEPDLSHAAMTVRLDSCIQCGLCVRACREEQGNDVIGMAWRGGDEKVVFDLDDPMGDSTCVACGECVQACPTGALMPSKDVGMVEPDKSVDTVCPYCGVGCQLTYQVKDDHIIRAEGRDGPANHGRLCVKGRYGFDYSRHPHRLTKPLIRRSDVPKSADLVLDPSNPLEAFREATWEEALDYAAEGLKNIRDRDGGDALAGFGCAKGSNEEAYLVQKLVRAGFGTNNVDHCTRLCHASSVAALMECIGSGAVSNPVQDVKHAEVIFVTGANPTVNHPVAATWMKNAADRGATLIYANPLRSDLADHADYYLQIRPGTDIALLNAMMHTILEDGLTDEDFIAKRTENFEEFRDNLKPYTPEAMAPICGIDPDVIRKVARLYAGSRASMIFWGMGIAQHTHGTDNCRCLISLALMTGQIGRPGTGLHPLRGQNNVQGASDAGLIPIVFPDYKPVLDPESLEYFEKFWSASLSRKAGLTVVEIMHAAKAGQIKGLYIMGENPAMSDPDAEHAREAIAGLEHLVVQDIFLTETAYMADVVLPASVFQEKTGTYTNTDRIVQLGRPALKLPGDARQDLWIIQEIARRIGLDWNYSGTEDVFEEMRQCMPSHGGITWERLVEEGAVVFPCRKEGDPGEPVMFSKAFPRKGGKGLFKPVQWAEPNEVPDEQFPYVLITGRQLEHWHTGAITRRSSVLDHLEPDPVCSVHPLDMEELGIEPGGTLTLSTRRGSISAYARADSGVTRRAVFMPFAFYEAAANILTNPELDPWGKIPEFKYCAVKVTPGGEPKPLVSFGGGHTEELQSGKTPASV